MDETYASRQSGDWLASALKTVPASQLHAVKAITVLSSPQQAYAFWRDLTNLPRFMEHLERVEIINNTVSRWTLVAPFGSRVSWDAEIIEDVAGQTLRWRSLPGADIQHHGAVHFTPAPGQRGCEVRVEFLYEAPGGAAGSVIAKLTGNEPNTQMGRDLRCFKQLLELGYMVHATGPKSEKKGVGQP